MSEGAVCEAIVRIYVSFAPRRLLSGFRALAARLQSVDGMPHARALSHNSAAYDICLCKGHLLLAALPPPHAKVVVCYFPWACA